MYSLFDFHRTRRAKSDRCLRRANIFLEQGEQWLALKTLVRFMVRLNSPCDDINLGVVDFLVSYLLPPSEDDTTLTAEELELRLSRLQAFVRVTLELPEDAELTPGLLEVTESGSEAFGAVVRYLITCLNTAEKATPEHIGYEDLHKEEKYFSAPKSYKDIELGLWCWPSLVRVIGPSENPSKLSSYVLIKCTRLISIMYEVNRHWGALFMSLSTKVLLPDSKFEMPNFSEKIFSSRSSNWCSDLYNDCPFFAPTDFRKRLMMTVFDLYHGCQEDEIETQTFEVSRLRPLDDIVSHFEKPNNPRAYWCFTFVNEIGYGPGPTKEFYTKASQDCSRYDLNLWLGEARKAKNDIEYVDSQVGLFPSPCLSLDEHSKNVLTAIGQLMAKSKTDWMMMDLGLSTAAYKTLVGTAGRGQYLKLSDIKYVMPSLTKFIEELVDVLKESQKILNDRSLTSEQIEQKLSELTFDGCAWEDLSIDFTLPGFPEIEMIPGGRDVLLTPENLDDYLKLIVWWLMYKGPQEKFDCLRSGFAMIVKGNRFSHFGAGDFENLFTGDKTEKQWLTSELQEAFRLDESLTSDSPTVKYFFEVLESFKTETQKQFLQFVTGSTRLPIGGLAALQPQLTLSNVMVNGDPDAYLPTSMTCVNKLFLPNYSRSDILKEKLILAITEGAETFQIR